MTYLNTNVYTDVIITYTKISHFITSEEEVKLRTISLGTQIILKSGERVATSNIADIIPIKKYYETFPDKKPISELKSFNFDILGIEESLKPYTKERRKKNLTNMRDRFLESFNGRPLNYEAKKLLTDMNMRIGTAEWERD